MPTLGRFRRELRWRFWSVPVEREVDAELAFHLEMRVRELLQQGMTPNDARAAALERFGDVDRITEACQTLGRRRNRDMRRAEWLTELFGWDLPRAVSMASLGVLFALTTFNVIVGELVPKTLALQPV